MRITLPRPATAATAVVLLAGASQAARLRWSSYALSGPIAEASLAGLNLDVAFIGVDGIDAKAGCTTHEEVEAHTNAVMIRHADRVVLVADSSKIGKVAFARICAASDVDELITDGAADAAAVRALTDGGVRVTLV
jgi:DeoR family transcriptional regulator of aga operon